MLLPRFGRWLVLFIGIVVFTAITLKPAIPAAAAKTKDALIQNVLDQLTFIYSSHPAAIGKTFKVTIKNFSVNDDETFVIIDGIARTSDYWQEPTDDFWTVTLPRGWKKVHPEDKGNDLSVMLGGQHQVQIVRQDLVNATRRNGIVREITITKKPSAR